MIQTMIPPDQWPGFCEQFGRQHQGWMTTIGRSEPSRSRGPTEATSTRVLADELPLQSVVLEARDQGYDLMLVAGTSPEHFTCVIHQPAQISFEQASEGEHVGLIVRDASGQTTIVRFRVAANPEMLDDLAPSQW